MHEQLIDIAVDDLMPDPSQPRKTFLEEEISRLAASIAARGILHPLRVIRDEQRRCWRILTGESRHRAAKQAGLKTVPCLVVEGELSEVEALADQLTENSVRHDLQPMEEAVALTRLKALKKCNSKALVEEYGFSGASITRMESLLKLPPEVQAVVGHGPKEVPPSAAYEISRLDDPLAQVELARLITERRLNRDSVAKEVRNRLSDKTAKASRAKRKNGKKASDLTLSLDHGVSILVSAKSLNWDGLISAINDFGEQVQKMSRDGKDISELFRLMRAS